MARPGLVTGRDFLESLKAAGIVGAKVRRVIIDAAVDAALMIYTEEIGDERIYEVSLLGLEIKIKGVKGNELQTEARLVPELQYRDFIEVGSTVDGIRRHIPGPVVEP